MTELAKISSILANFLLFSYLSIQDESGTFIILYFIISFYGVIENQLFYFLKNKSNLQTSRNHQKNRRALSNNDIVTYIYLVILSCLCIVLLYFSIPNLIGEINLTILLSIIIFKLVASFIEIFYEMIGHGERSFIVKNLALFLAAIAIIAVDQFYFIQTHFLLVLYYILSSVLSILFILFFIFKDDGESFHRVHQDIQGTPLKFQIRLLLSTLAGYISGQYLFLMIPNGLEFYKFTAILFVFGGVVVTVASSSIISKRAIKESNDSLRNNSGFWLVLVFYMLVLLIPFFIKTLLDILSSFALISSQIIDNITHLTSLIHSDMGTKIIIIMMISNMILIQLIKTAIFYRRLIIEPIYYSNFIILTIIAIYYFINITVTPLVFVSLNLVFALTVLLELLIFKRNKRSERNNF